MFEVSRRPARQLSQGHGAVKYNVATLVRTLVFFADKFGPDRIFRTKNHIPFRQILQFSNVAGPGMLRECPKDRRRKWRGTPVELFVVVIQQRSEERRVG